MSTLQRQKFKHIFKKLKWFMIIAMIILFLSFSGYMIMLLIGNQIVDEEQLLLAATTTFETTEGQVVGELYDEYRKLISIDQIPEHVIDAFIAVEDKRFYQHGGIDFKSVLRAVYRDLLAFDKVEGASTITQQLVKNLFLTHEKTWLRKTKEVMGALYLERQYAKNEILELYLNAIYFGHGAYGIEAASQTFFSKPAEELSIAEGALLAGMIKAPYHYSPIDHPERAKERRNVVLQIMEDENMLTTSTRLQEQGKALGLKFSDRSTHPAYASYLDLVIREANQVYQLTNDELRRGGYRIVINMDELSQQVAYRTFQEDDYFPGNTEGVEGAFVMLEQTSGKIVAALGGRHHRLGDLNRLTVKRQPGSTIKPLAVYGPALMTDEYGPYTMISDKKMDHDGYVVANADHQYEGSILLFEAISKSKNTSAVWLLDQIGIDYAKDFLSQMEMNIPDEGLAIALGGLSEGLTPLQMAAGYRTFVHDGEYIQPFTISQIYNRHDELIAEAEREQREVFSPQVAWDMTRILANAVKEGTGQVGDFDKALAGKTGSTEHPHVAGMYKDAWFVGYTPEYVTALWMGYDVTNQDHYLTAGSSYPTMLTKQILSTIDQQRPLAAQFTVPEHVQDLADPIHLPQIEEVDIQYIFGGFSLLKGKISWDASDDPRIVYRIYRKESNFDELIGEVTGHDDFIIDDISLFRKHAYYVVPYDPLTKREGEPSKVIELSLFGN